MSVTFAEPYNAPYNETVTLRNPVLGDSRQINLKTQIKQNMAGAIHTHKKTESNSKFLLTFTTLVETIKDEFIAFYDYAIGKELRYTDHDGIDWRVKFVMESLTVITIRDNCDYNLTVEIIRIT